MTSGRIVYIILLIGTFFFFVFEQSWILFFLLLLLIGVPVISLIGLLISAKRTNIRVSAAKSVIRGGSGQIIVRCETSSPFPFAHALIAVDVSDSIVTLPRQFYIISAGDSVEIPFFTDHCTDVRIRFSKCCLCDMLGLFTIKRPRDDVHTIVLPRSAPIVPKPRLLNAGDRATGTKTGSGFSEIYEFRDYRPGDRLRDVHWKLSAKYDRFIVREPQEALEQLVTIAVDIGSTPDENDYILDRLSYLTERLLAEETDILVLWKWPQNGFMDNAYVTDRTSLFSMWQKILAVPAGTYQYTPVYSHSDTPSFFHLKCHGEAEK